MLDGARVFTHCNITLLTWTYDELLPFTGRQPASSSVPLPTTVTFRPPADEPFPGRWGRGGGGTTSGDDGHASLDAWLRRRPSSTTTSSRSAKWSSVLPDCSSQAFHKTTVLDTSTQEVLAKPACLPTCQRWRWPSSTAASPPPPRPAGASSASSSPFSLPSFSGVAPPRPRPAPAGPAPPPRPAGPDRNHTQQETQ